MLIKSKIANSIYDIRLQDDFSFKVYDKNNPDVPFKPIAILRNHKTIIPRGDIKLHGKDHIYCITKNDTIDQLVKFVGKDLVKVKR